MTNKKEIEDCTNCSHNPRNAISCLRGACRPITNKTCKNNTWRKNE